MEDAVQITFEKIIKKVSLLRDFHDMDRVKQYIYVVAKNTALVMLRAKQKVVLLEEIPIFIRHQAHLSFPARNRAFALDTRCWAAETDIESASAISV